MELNGKSDSLTLWLNIPATQHGHRFQLLDGNPHQWIIIRSMWMLPFMLLQIKEAGVLWIVIGKVIFLKEEQGTSLEQLKPCMPNHWEL